MRIFDKQTGETIWPRAHWDVEYREMRQYARISAHALDRLMQFRGFGVLADQWIEWTRIGRIRVSDWRNRPSLILPKEH